VILVIPSVDHEIEVRNRLMPLLAASRPTLSFVYDAMRAPDALSCSASVDEIAAHVLARLDRVARAHVHLLGISVGGLVAQEVALSAPERLASMTLASTSCGDPSMAVQPEPIAANMLVMRASLPPRASVEAMIPYAYATATPRARITEDVERRLRDYPETASAHLHQVMRASRWRLPIERLRNAAVPTLVVHGTHDRMVPFRNAEILASAIPGARLVGIRGAGHMLSTDAPRRLAHAVAEFHDGVAKEINPPEALVSGTSPGRTLRPVLQDDTSLE
jgi:pimeloyl-ACP methyl ester carboxylesterase